MKRLSIIWICWAGLLMSCSSDVANVKISGSLKQFGLDRVSMNYMGISAEVYNNKTVDLYVDSNGMFSVELTLKEPAYYVVGENVLYLSPEDDLKVVFNRSSSKTEYEGLGSELNTYLKKCSQLDAYSLFKQGWDFEALSKPPVDFDTYKQKTDSVVNVRKLELANLKQASSDFQEMEKIRLVARQLMVYLDYFSIGRLSKWDDKQEVKLKKKQAFYHTIVGLAEPLLTEITASERYLELPEVRKVLLECANTNVFTFRHSPQFEELVKVLDISGKLDHGIMKKDYEEYKTFAGQIQNKDLREAYEAKLQARTKLMEGSPAIDFSFKDIDGKEYHLSDFKGTPIYIDIWATWCLPCLAQKPDFEELSELYPDIQFLGISIDQKVEWWKKKLKKDGIPEHVGEFVANVYDLDEEWDISSIPRFFLIDKDFNIISAFAPRPSERDKIVPMLDAIQ